MSIKYRLEPFRNNISKEGKQGVFPQLIKGRTVTIKDLAKKISIDSSFTEGDVLGILQNLTENIALFLSLGSNVNLDGLGTLSLTATLKNKDLAPHQIRSDSIRIKNVRFRTSPYFKKRLQDTTFIKAKNEKTLSAHTEQEKNNGADQT